MKHGSGINLFLSKNIQGETFQVNLVCVSSVCVYVSNANPSHTHLSRLGPALTAK